MTQVYEHHPLTHTTRTMPQLIKFKYNTPPIPPSIPPRGSNGEYGETMITCVSGPRFMNRK